MSRRVAAAARRPTYVRLAVGRVASDEFAEAEKEMLAEEEMLADEELLAALARL